MPTWSMAVNRWAAASRLMGPSSSLAARPATPDGLARCDMFHPRRSGNRSVRSAEIHFTNSWRHSMSGTSVIVAGARTPIGRLLGGLKDLSAADLGGVAIKGALDKAGVSGDQVD